MKNNKKYFAFCTPCGSFEVFDTEKEARDYAKFHLEIEKDNAPDGWHDCIYNGDGIGYGELTHQTQMRNVRQDSSRQFDTLCDFKLIKIKGGRE